MDGVIHQQISPLRPPLLTVFPAPLGPSTASMLPLPGTGSEASPEGGGGGPATPETPLRMCRVPPREAGRVTLTWRLCQLSTTGEEEEEVAGFGASSASSLPPASLMLTTVAVDRASSTGPES